MATKKLSGKQAILYKADKGALIEGDGIADLADVSWFEINSYAATGSQLPIGVETAVFKSPDSGNAIKPIADDDVYPLTLTQLCKTDLSISSTKGTIDVTDDCDNGYNSYIVDGYTDLTGSINGFMKFNDPVSGLPAAQKDILKRFFAITEDSGAGVYTVTEKTDDKYLLMVLLNSEEATAAADVQTWFILPVHLTGSVTDKPLKGVQNLDLTWSKAEGYAQIYERTLNSEDVA